MKCSNDVESVMPSTCNASEHSIRIALEYIMLLDRDGDEIGDWTQYDMKPIGHSFVNQSGTFNFACVATKATSVHPIYLNNSSQVVQPKPKPDFSFGGVGAYDFQRCKMRTTRGQPDSMIFGRSWQGHVSRGSTLVLRCGLP